MPASTGWVASGRNADGTISYVQKTEWAANFFKNTPGGGAAAATEFRTTTGALSSSTIGGLARKAIRGGVYGVAVTLAVEGIIDGAGWAINELKDQVTSPGSKESLDAHGWCRGSNCASTIHGLLPWAQQNFRPSDPSIVSRWIAVETSLVDGYLCALVKPEFGGGCSVSVPVEFRTRPVSGWGDFVNVGVGTDPSPVSDDQLGDAIRDNPRLVNDLLTDPRTGRPIMTPELQQQGEQLKRDIEQREGLPTSDPLPNPNLEDDAPKDDGSPWPSFCGWATVVCDFIEWFKKPGDPDVDLPEREIQFDQDGWSSGVGGGTCPQAQEFSVDLVGTTGRASFDFQPLCSFATTMRPVLIAVCAVIAAFILAGLRSSGGGKS
ncbi:virulence factor TspB C-terminal domain-related protein [Stenotrophomonas sp. PS02297]|uniref:virulence factor TspB C-terminal domain-related protein n=1 Tax=Stenotrophomonas sp. PS02297 TaxID=2991423 RepID=UPI00249A4BA5|nr:virulence factor TspB C-terminal domain-related protein [Stenotrophomonas sp. PS02297]